MATVQVTAPVRGREKMFQGMRCVDTTRNPRIPVIMELVAALSRATDPQEVLRIYGEGYSRLHGPRGYISLSTRGLKPGEYRITRLLTSFDSVKTVHQPDTWSKREQIPIQRGGFLGEIIRNAYPELIQYLNVKDDPIVGDALANFGSMLAIPLFDAGEPLNWAIMLDEDPEGFSESELEETILRGNLVGGTVRTTLISKQLREANRQIEHQVSEVARIQKSLLPTQLPKIAGVTLTAHYQTFDQAGGDYYDFISLDACSSDFRCTRTREGTNPDGLWGVFIADAAGHGPGAAVIMAILHTLLHSYPLLPKTPAEVLEHMNRQLAAKQIDGTFATAFFGMYDTKTKKFSYARAGHSPPLLKVCGSGGKVSRLDAVGGLPLGVVPNPDYETAVVTLETGQTIVFYTDGINEAKDPQGAMYGVEGIERSLHECSGEPDCVVHSITEALRAHEAGVRPSDDQTIVAMKID